MSLFLLLTPWSLCYRSAMAGITLEEREGNLRLQCLPLYTILLALGNPTVNYFSLDIEGAEYPVLQTIPWDKVDIQVQSLPRIV